MSAKVFFDTNILVYARDDRDPRKQRIAAELITKHGTSRTGVISYQVVQELFNVLIVKASQKISHADAQVLLETVLRPLLSIHSSMILFSEAIRLQERYRLSWYDSLIVSAAQHANCDTLYSEDLQHGQQFGAVTVRNPFVS
jgi:predicted nucleic acid-binding protein